MTPIDRFERQLPAALADLADERTPDYLIDILGRTARTRQRSAWTHPGRWLSMTGPTTRPAFAAIAAAALVVVIGGGILLTRSNDHNGVGGPTPAPTTAPVASPSNPPTAAADPSAEAAQVPAVLQSTWIGQPRVVANLPARDRYRFALGPISFSFPDDGLTHADLRSDAAADGPDRLRITSIETKSGCTTGDVGEYTWSLSPGGGHLTITAVTDACATRSAALVGSWLRVACTDTKDGCFGNLEAGTYPTQYLDPRVDPGARWVPNYGAITYTVPDGWANAEDWPETFDLMTSDVYALQTKDAPPTEDYNGILLRAQPAAIAAASSCDDTLLPSVGRTVDALVGWLRHQPAFVVSAPTNVTIDGHPGRQVDVTLAANWDKTCGTSKPAATMFGYARGGTDDWTWGVLQGERQRLILLDLGGGDVLLIAIDSTYPDRWADLLAQATPIVQSFHFK